MTTTKPKAEKKKWYKVEYFTTLEPPKSFTESLDGRYEPKGIRVGDLVDDILVFSVDTHTPKPNGWEELNNFIDEMYSLAWQDGNEGLNRRAKWNKDFQHRFSQAISSAEDNMRKRCVEEIKKLVKRLIDLNGRDVQGMGWISEDELNWVLYFFS